MSIMFYNAFYHDKTEISEFFCQAFQVMEDKGKNLHEKVTQKNYVCRQLFLVCFGSQEIISSVVVRVFP